MGVEKGFAEVMTIIELMEMTNGSVRLVQRPEVSGSQRALAEGAGQPAAPRVPTSRRGPCEHQRSMPSQLFLTF